VRALPACGDYADSTPGLHAQPLGSISKTNRETRGIQCAFTLMGARYVILRAVLPYSIVGDAWCVLTKNGYFAQSLFTSPAGFVLLSNVDGRGSTLGRAALGDQSGCECSSRMQL